MSFGPVEVATCAEATHATSFFALMSGMLGLVKSVQMQHEHDELVHGRRARRDVARIVFLVTRGVPARPVRIRRGPSRHDQCA